MSFKVIVQRNGTKGNKDACRIWRLWSNRRVDVSEIQIYRPFLLVASATTLMSVWHTPVFRTALTALTEPCMLWRRIMRYRSPCIGTSCTLWWRIRIIRTTRVLHSSQGLQLCWSRLHNAWRSTKRLGAPGSAGDKPGSAGDMSGTTSNHSHVFSLYSHLCIYVTI